MLLNIHNYKEIYFWNFFNKYKNLGPDKRFFTAFHLRTCDTQEIRKFDSFQVSTWLWPRYIKVSVQNLGNGIEDKNGRS